MKLDTIGGKSFDIRVICADLRSKNRVLIELEDDRPLAQIAADFDGIDGFVTYKEDLEGVYETYEGYNHLVSIRRNAEAGTVRLTLERSASNG